MTFNGINIIGIIVAFGFSFVSGAIWFGPKTFYPVWMKARGVASGQLTPSKISQYYSSGGTILGVLIQTLTLALIINSLQQAGRDIGITDGAGIGLALGVGVAAFASLSHRLFGGESLKVWIIETANDAINLTVAGAILAYFS